MRRARADIGAPGPPWTTTAGLPRALPAVSQWMRWPSPTSRRPVASGSVTRWPSTARSSRALGCPMPVDGTRRRPDRRRPGVAAAGDLVGRLPGVVAGPNRDVPGRRAFGQLEGDVLAALWAA